jgi:hypothetical protein
MTLTMLEPSTIVYCDPDTDDLPVAHLPSALPHRALCGQPFTGSRDATAADRFEKCPACLNSWGRRG